MISGPVASRGRVALTTLVEPCYELLESGLQPTAAAIDLGDVGALSAVARDALGLPTLVWLEDRILPAMLTGRIARVFAHLVERPPVLQRLFGHRLPRLLDRSLRVIVAAQRVDQEALGCLQRLSLPDLTVVEVSDIEVGGERQTVARTAATWPRRVDDGFSPPSGIASATHIGLASELLSWLARLDADVVVEGDRYSRRLLAGGRPLCTLRWHAGELVVRIGDGEQVPMVDRAAAVAALDRLMAAFARGLTGGGAGPETDRGPAAAGAIAEVRRIVRETRLSGAELAALQGRDREPEVRGGGR